MSDRDPRQRNDRRPQGDRPQTSANAQINFVSVEYNPRTEVLSSVVQVTRGNQPLGNQRVSFLIDDEQVDLNITSKENGYAKLHTVRKLSLGTHKLGAQIPTIGLSVNEIFTVSSSTTASVDTPNMVVTYTATPMDDAFQVVLSVAVSKRGGALTMVQVDFLGVGLDVTEYTNPNGVATKLILVPHPSRSRKQYYEVRICLPKHGVYQNVVLELERSAVKLPTQLTVMRPVETEVGTGNYKLRITAEHDEGVARGVTVSVAGGTDIVDGVTDNRGIVDIELQCTPGQTFTVFQVDVAGINDTHELTLLGQAFAKAARWKRNIGIAFVSLTGAAVLITFGFLIHALMYLLTMVKYTIQAKDVPAYTMGTYAVWILPAIGVLLIATVSILTWVFGASAKSFWDRARWRYHFARSGTVLKRDEPTMWGSVIRKSLGLPAVTPVATATTVAASTSAQPSLQAIPEAAPVPVPQVTSVQPEKKQSALSDNFSTANLMQWGSIIALAMNEILFEKRRK